MYEPFFGLDSSPFGLTPNPRFLFRSKVHHEILSLLLYGVTTSKGVMLLLGEVGTGKTTLCRALLRELPAEAESVLLLNPHLSETELVGAILDDLGLERRGSTRGELMTVLSQYLLAAGGAGTTVVVAVDTVKAAICSVEGRPLARWARRVAAAVAVVAAIGTTLGLWTWRSGWSVQHASNSVLAAVALPAAPPRAPTPRPGNTPEPSSAP